MAQSTQAKKLATITAEVDSLKVVLEMRTEEIHTLRNESVRLEEKLEEFDAMKIELGKSNAQAEDLKEQLNSRLDLERYGIQIIKLINPSDGCNRNCVTE